MSIRIWTGAHPTQPNDWNVIQNWTPSGVAPVTSDDVYIQNSAVDITEGLDQSGVSLNSLTIDQSFTGTVGTLSTPLKIGFTKPPGGTNVVIIGRDTAPSANAPGSGRLNLELNGNAACFLTINVEKSATFSLDPGASPIRLNGTNITSLYVMNGMIDVAMYPGQAVTIPTLDIAGSESNVNFGLGSVATSCNQTDGNLVAFGTLTTFTQIGGTATLWGPACTTANVGGLTIFNGTGPITLNVLNHGIADFSKNQVPKNVTTINLYSGSALNLNNGVINSITIANPIVLKECALSDVTLSSWINNTITLA